MKKINILGTSKEEFEDIQKESQSLRRLSHPNIIKYHAQFTDSRNFYLIMEYANAGDLESYIDKKMRGRVPR